MGTDPQGSGGGETVPGPAADPGGQLHKAQLTVSSVHCSVPNDLSRGGKLIAYWMDEWMGR